MAILDRSWYGRVLVERVEGFATEAEWQRAYDEINAFERMLTDDGMVLVKLWLHLSDEEQLKRFEAREKDPLKAYKLTDEDWRNRGKRDRLHGGGRGHARAHEHRLGAVAPRRGRLEALRPREGARDGDRGRPRTGLERARAQAAARLALRPSAPALRACSARGVFAARLRLRLARVLVRALVRSAVGSSRSSGGSLRARVARDPPADPMKRTSSAAADDVQRVAADVVVARSRRARRSAPGSAGPAAAAVERVAVLGERGGGGASRARASEEDRRGGRMSARKVLRRAGAPVSAQRLPAKRAPQVSSRTAISPARPSQTPRMPQPWSSASSATGT